MSLINEALKKAQRSRTAGADHSLPPLPGGGHVTKRGQAQSANTMVLIGSGALVLVVLSVAVTVYLVNRPASKSSAPTISSKVAVVAPVATETPATVKPIIPAEPVAAAPTPPPSPATETVKPAPAEVTHPAIPAAKPPPPSAPVAVAPPPPSQPAAAPASQVSAPTPDVPPAPRLPSSPPGTPPRPDERIATYIESIRIAGVRAQGADSRVLINERVYRVNDIIERTLGIRLVKVDSGSLIFSDASGATYTKFL